MNGFKPINDRAAVTLPPVLHCEHKRSLTRHLPPVSGLYAPYTHYNCVRNELVSLRERVVGQVPRPTPEGLQSLRAVARDTRVHMGQTSPMSSQSFVAAYSGKKRARYQRALESLRHRPLDIKRESVIQAFVKSEKNNPVEKVNSPPRMIQAYNARFNISTGVHLRPIEHKIYRLKDSSGLDAIGKGKSLEARARLLLEKFERFPDAIAITMDCSRFDQHVSNEILRIENSIYKWMDRDPEFAALLDAQLSNRGWTQGGIKYRTKDGRASGSMQTALGNCLIDYIMLGAMCRVLNIDQFERLVDGDDAVLIIPEKYRNKIAKFPEVFLSFGQELKVEQVTKDVNQVKWCQKWIISVDGVPKFVPDWRKTLSCGAAGVKYWHDRGVSKMAHAVGHCWMSMCAGVPIIQQYASQLIQAGNKINRDIFDSDLMYQVRNEIRDNQLGTVKAKPITLATRVSFQEIFGVTVAEQLAIEKRLSTWVPSCNVVDVVDELLPQWDWAYSCLSDPTGL